MNLLRLARSVYILHSYPYCYFAQHYIYISNPAIHIDLPNMMWDAKTLSVVVHSHPFRLSR